MYRKTFIMTVILFFFVFILAFSQDVKGDISDIKPQIDLSIEKFVSAQDSGFLHVDFTIPHGWHQILQKDFFYVEPTTIPGLVWGQVNYAVANEEVAGIPSYSGMVRISIPFEGSSTLLKGLEVRAGWQLCYDDGVCLRPQSQIFILNDSKNGSVSFSWISLLLYAAAGMLGGFLLNLMPCVLPVISFKMMGILGAGGMKTAGVKKKFLLNAAGIIASMLLLAFLTIGLKLTGESAGWGFQFQNIYFQLFLIILMWLMALSFAGFWEAGGILTSKASRWSSAGDFFSGALVVVLATPCTAPFLGSALGFAFVSPVWAIAIIFFFASLGLALPFLLLAAFPHMINFFPKPGLWMEKLKMILGFVMTAVVLWLTWIYSYSNPEGVFSLLFFLLILAFNAWIFGQRLASSYKIKRILLTILPLIVSIVTAIILVPEFSFQTKSESNLERSGVQQTLPEPWEIFDEETVRNALATDRTVFIDFTARWCLTCRINEAGILSSREFLDAAKNEDVLLLRGDYTSFNPVIEKWLERYRRAGVPFYLLLGPSVETIYPELLGPGFLEEFENALGSG